jgi:glycosyltransferase involved in cell wall biosynthesis
MSEPVNVSHASATSDTRTDASPVAGLVSVIMPLYNGELYVAHAIDSVLAQTYGKVEVVAIDDGSPDKSGEIAARYGDPVRVLSKTNGGVASARNAGFAVARGEYIAFLDQDDWWDSNKLTEQMAIFAANPEVALVHSLVTYYDADGHNALPLLNEHAGTDEIVGHCFDRLLLGNGMYNSSVIVKRAALDVVGVADLSIPGNTVQDYDLWLRVAKQFPFGLVPHSTTMLRIHGEQGIWNRLAMLEAELRVLFKNCPAEDWR